MTARHATPGSRRARRGRLLPLTLAMITLNLLLPETAWASCAGSLTTQSFPPESGTANNDVIEGNEEDNAIDGAGGNDVICGNGGPDYLIGAAGNDRLHGGQGDDLLDLGPAANVGDTQESRGGPGDDLMGDGFPYGGDSDETIYGDTGDDQIYTGPGEDTIYGGPDDDYLFAEDGGTKDPVVDGGPGYDVCEVDLGIDITFGCEEVY